MADDKKKVESASRVGKEDAKHVEAINSSVDSATQKVADQGGDQGTANQRFVAVDAVLGQDEKHGDLVRTAQAATMGEEYDPKNDPESASYEPTPEAPVRSLNQNNLKHPASEEYADPYMSKNYLGQPI